MCVRKKRGYSVGDCVLIPWISISILCYFSVTHKELYEELLKLFIFCLEIRMGFYWFSGSIVSIARRECKWQHCWRQKRGGQCSCGFVSDVYIYFWQFEKHRWVRKTISQDFDFCNACLLLHISLHDLGYYDYWSYLFTYKEWLKLLLKVKQC